MPNPIDDILRREGGATKTNDPNDKGGRTQWGISERSHPSAWIDGKVTEQEARDIYERLYLKAPGFDQIHDTHLRWHLVDFGVNSGPTVAIRKLQGILKVDVDGILGSGTLSALDAVDAKWVSNQLVGERVRMIAKIVQRSPDQLKFLGGWCNRATEWLR